MDDNVDINIKKSSLKTLLKDEFINGRTCFDWGVLFFGILLQILGNIYNYLSKTLESGVLILSGLSFVFYVVLSSQGKISSYIFGFVQIITYVFGFTIPNSLHGETIEYGVFYTLTFIVGIITWLKNYKKDKNTKSIELKAKKLSVKGNIVLFFLFSIASILYYCLLKTVPMFGKLDSDPLVDSISSTPAYFGQMLAVLGFREQYIYWFFVNFFSIFLSLRAGSILMALQFAFSVFLSLYGFYRWTRSVRKESYEDIF